jgi:lipopolysaccharide export LptBFGC system permease protein LptF
MSQGSSDTNIADRLGVSPVHINLLKRQMEKKFGANDEEQLLEETKDLGIGPNDVALYINAQMRTQLKTQKKQEEEEQSQRNNEKSAPFRWIFLLIVLVPFCTYILSGGSSMWYFTIPGILVLLALAWWLFSRRKK